MFIANINSSTRLLPLKSCCNKNLEIKISGRRVLHIYLSIRIRPATTCITFTNYNLFKIKIDHDQEKFETELYLETPWSYGNQFRK